MSERHPLITALLAELPEPGPWAKETRQKWLVALGASLDLLYPAGQTPAPAVKKGDDALPLTENQEHVLGALLRMVGANQNDWTPSSLQKIAQESGVATGSLTPILERLISLNLVERRINPETKTAEWREPT